MKTHGLDYEPILVGNVWLSIHYERTTLHYSSQQADLKHIEMWIGTMNE